METLLGRLPDFLCIGGQRCGSTTLWELFRQDPQVFMPKQKELHYFDDRDQSYENGMEWYSMHFSAAKPDQLCGEITPDYLCWPACCHRIAQALPDAKLLAILRDPVKRAWSNYWMRVRMGQESLSFERALEAEPQRMKSSDSEIRRRYGYVSWGRYIDHLRRFDQCFSRDHIFVTTLEELIADRPRVVCELWAHLGLKPGPQVISATLPHENNGAHPRYLPLHAALLKCKKWGKQENSLAHRAVRRFAKSASEINSLSCLPAMGQKVADWLRGEFHDSDQQLAQWLGRSLPWTH